MEFMMLTCVNQQFNNYYAKQMNLQEIFFRTKHVMYLEAFTGVKVPIFLRKMRAEDVDHEMDL